MSESERGTGELTQRMAMLCERSYDPPKGCC